MTTPFNFNEKPPVNKWLLWLAVVLLLWLLFVLPGCEIIKHTKKSNTDSVSVSRKNTSTIDTTQSGGVSKSSTLSKEDFDWWKTTLHFGEHKDTNIYNFHNYPQQPATIIYEGGKGTKETQTNTLDSNWIKNALTQYKNEYDSSHLKSELKEKDKESETKGLGLWAIILIVVCTTAGQGLIKAGFKKLPFKIIRVNNA
jgi:hypothetical protein